jgi:hypothetical protein
VLWYETERLIAGAGLVLPKALLGQPAPTRRPAAVIATKTSAAAPIAAAAAAPTAASAAATVAVATVATAAVVPKPAAAGATTRSASEGYEWGGSF